MSNIECKKIETLAVHGSKGYDETTGAISFPIYQSATFRHPALNESTGYDYSRLQNPTREEVEKTVAKLEGGSEGLAFSSGVAAIAAVLGLFQKGDHIIVSDDLYGGTYRLFENIFSCYGIEYTFVDTSINENILHHLTEKTKAIFIETPSNPMMKVTDILKVVQIARDRSLLTIVDNTFLSPYFQQPLQLGVDIVVHSGTKFLGGHNDTLAGFITLSDKGITEKLRYIQKSTGGVLAPFDSWLILRGIKTLHIRMERQQQNAIVVAKWLKEQPQVEKVYYVGLPEHEGYDINLRQARGFGSMISFSVKDVAMVEKILGNVRVISFAESLGGVESLITYPKLQTHAEIQPEVQQKLGITERLLRLSVGIENVDDIIEDLKNAFGGNAK